MKLCEKVWKYYKNKFIKIKYSMSYRKIVRVKTLNLKNFLLI